MPGALLSFTNNNFQWINNTSSVEDNTSSRIEDYQGRSVHITLLSTAGLKGLSHTPDTGVFGWLTGGIS